MGLSDSTLTYEYRPKLINSIPTAGCPLMLIMLIYHVNAATHCITKGF